MSKVYDYVTENIIRLLEKGVVPWRKTWNPKLGAPRNGITGYEYRGINVWLIASAGFASPLWYTKKQLGKKGGRIKKGEKGTMIVFWKIMEKENKEGKKETFPLLRYYKVWNLEQIDGVENPLTEEKTFDPIEEAEKVIKQSPIKIPVLNSSLAAYSPSTDTIRMPLREDFESPEAYYATLFHEYAHATGHGDRLGRDLTGLFGDHKYSTEELTAEMASAYVCAVAGINADIENSAAYIAHWKRKLTEDHRLIMRVSSAAQKAANYILGVHLEKNNKKEKETTC